MTIKFNLPAGLFGALNIITKVRALGAFTEGWLEVEGPEALYGRALNIEQNGQWVELPKTFLGWKGEVVGMTQGSGWEEISL